MQRLVLSFLLAAAVHAGDSPIVASINSFTIATYQQLARGDRNLALSPFNIAAALSMTLPGARGRTATEIATVLRQHYDASYDANFAGLVDDLTKSGNTGANELLNANALWVQKGFSIQPRFEETIANAYRSLIAPLDFAANPEGARSEINRWTEQHTKDKIKDLFPGGSL